MKNKKQQKRAPEQLLDEHLTYIERVMVLGKVNRDEAEDMLWGLVDRGLFFMEPLEGDEE